jgi:serine/threonine-protein kinase RsbW
LRFDCTPPLGPGDEQGRNASHLTSPAGSSALLAGNDGEAHTMNATRVSYTLESTLASVNKAEQSAEEVAARSGFDTDECGRIALAVREATVNAVLHGNRCDPTKHVTVSFDSTPEALTMAVRDEGPGLNPATLPDPLAPENLLKESGRGIFLIRAFMDEVRFRILSPGTEVIMVKFVRGPDRGGSKEDNQ